VAIAAIALVSVIVLGTSDHHDSAQSPTTTITPSSTVAPTAAASATSGTATPTTTPALVSFLTQILSDATGVTIVGVSPDGQVRRAELDTGRVETLPFTVERVPTQTVALSDGLVGVVGRGLILDYATEGTYSVPGEGLYAAVAFDEFWTVEQDRTYGATRSGFGRPTSTVHHWRKLPGARPGELAPVVGIAAAPSDIRVIGDDVIYAAGGSIYRFWDGVARRIAVGQFADPIGARTRDVSVLSCDADGVCQTVVVDATGQELDRVNAQFDVSLLSPDGRSRVMSWADGTARHWQIIDAQSGSPLANYVDSGSDIGPLRSAVAWTPDSTHVLIPLSTGLAAWNPTMAEPRHLGIARLAAIDILVQPALIRG
jgi:WD40 repeat protein